MQGWVDGKIWFEEKKDIYLLIGLRRTSIPPFQYSMVAARTLVLKITPYFLGVAEIPEC